MKTSVFSKIQMRNISKNTFSFNTSTGWLVELSALMDMHNMIFASIVFLWICNFPFRSIQRFWKNAQLTRSVISGFGKRSQQAGAEIGADPDLYTACKVVNSYPDPACQFAKPVWVSPACQVPNHTGMHCLPSSRYGRQCTACQVVKVWRAVTLTPKTVNVFLPYWQ